MFFTELCTLEKMRVMIVMAIFMDKRDNFPHQLCAPGSLDFIVAQADSSHVARCLQLT